MASLDDILTVQKNGVIALNNLYHETINSDGFLTSLEISTGTLVQTGAGKIVRVSVIVAGSSAGTIYDADSAATAITGRRVYIISNSATGIQSVFMPVRYGIYVTPGTGQIVTLSYS